MDKDVFHRIKECKLTRNLKHNEPSAPVHTHFVKPIISNTIGNNFPNINQTNHINNNITDSTNSCNSQSTN
jgi:hypothetical protein